MWLFLSGCEMTVKKQMPAMDSQWLIDGQILFVCVPEIMHERNQRDDSVHPVSNQEACFFPIWPIAQAQGCLCTPTPS